MKWKLVIVFLIVAMILVACNGVGKQGPPGPPGAPGECTDEQCEVPEGIITEIMVLQSGLEAVTDRVDVIEANPGGIGFTRKVPVDIYCDNGLINPDAVKEVLGLIKGTEFVCQFKLDNALKISEECLAYYCVPVDDGQPSGYAKFFDGVGRYTGGPGNHGRTVQGVAEWERPPGYGGIWGVRIELSNYDRFTDEQALGGAKYIGKRYPWTAGGNDHWQITIPIP